MFKHNLQSPGRVTGAQLFYDAHGKSNGIAAITFGDSTSANAAFRRFDKRTLDGRVLKMEIVLDTAPSVYSRLG